MRVLSILVVSTLVIVACATRVGEGPAGEGAVVSNAVTSPSWIIEIPEDLPELLEPVVPTENTSAEIVDDETEFVPPAPVRIRVNSVGIAAPVDVVNKVLTHPCENPHGSACLGRVDMLDSPERAMPCQTGFNLFSGHVSWLGERETFTRLVDSREFGGVTGVEVGDLVAVELDDGSTCYGTVVDWTQGPGEKIEGTPARYWDKNAIGTFVDELNALGDGESVGLLTTSYCGQCTSGDWYAPGERDPNDQFWHRRYTAAVLVQWLGTVKPTGWTAPS
ncbi:MAG: hypothetical protein A3G58_00225 [Candidatus Colwellbacteria bacterium RIFCSPLOWO2_12_FULL_46_17]|uniref:Lipoprotein n=1 Tax=Candidatus Colwellbacteria bacterium RIFCSPLOWO2_12_FULL_46_17 TaxID=1797695 RepID=A0A1G1ZEM7_9BACT|nr:MAG: hypothetical protein A3G58_00225 [Candidatus Colwellbacteria bacterium RIFCSPLOWO2_12_FULL_46_17]